VPRGDIVWLRGGGRLFEEDFKIRPIPPHGVGFELRSSRKVRRKDQTGRWLVVDQKSRRTQYPLKMRRRDHSFCIHRVPSKTIIKALQNRLGIITN
jgi:hypothetical protein